MAVFEIFINTSLQVVNFLYICKSNYAKDAYIFLPWRRHPIGVSALTKKPTTMNEERKEALNMALSLNSSVLDDDKPSANKVVEDAEKFYDFLVRNKKDSNNYTIFYDGDPLDS